ncbi:MAG: cyclophilin-like fold protein [Alcaligenes sp.]
MLLELIVGEQRCAITWTDNETVQALAALLPLTIDTSMAALPRNEGGRRPPFQDQRRIRRK